MRIQIFGLILILVVNVDGWWLTIPSAKGTLDSGSSQKDNCGPMTPDSYYWDTEDDSHHGDGNSWSGAIPRGNYDSNIKQYFCTGTVDLMLVGSYCFYQNRQNGNFELRTIILFIIKYF